MANLKLFREQVDFYLFQAGIESKERNVDERRGMTQAELADACGLNRAELNRKLNGKSPISSILVKNIVIALAKRYGITMTPAFLAFSITFAVAMICSKSSKISCAAAK